jgi:hypothetical protein
VRDFQKHKAELTKRLKRAYKVAIEDHQIEGLSVRAIDPEAIAWFRENWQFHSKRIPDWDWAHSDFRPDKGVNIAIWHGDFLCGFASGALTGNSVRLDFVEAFPGRNPLKGRIIPIALTVCDAYADLCGREQLRITGVTEELVPIYERFGFEVESERRNVHVMRRKEA